MPYDNFDRFADLVVMISILGLWITMFGYGEWRYHEGVKAGRKKERRMLKQANRREVMIYRVK